MGDVIARFSGQHEYLSNFHNSSVTMLSGGRNIVLATGEHAFQYMKAHAAKGPVEEYVQAMIDAPTPAKAKYLGRSISLDLDKWEAMKDDCMRKVIFAKFTEHDDLRARLLSTGASLLVEGNDWGDTYWGRCDGKGKNILGSIIMEVRGYYQWLEILGQPTKASELQAKLALDL